MPNVQEGFHSRAVELADAGPLHGTKDCSDADQNSGLRVHYTIVLSVPGVLGYFAEEPDCSSIKIGGRMMGRTIFLIVTGAGYRHCVHGYAEDRERAQRICDIRNKRKPLYEFRIEECAEMYEEDQ